MNLLVDTSVWSLAFRRDGTSDAPEVRVLHAALIGAGSVLTTGLVLQELLQGFGGPHGTAAILARFDAIPLIQPDRLDQAAAADIRNTCRRAGVQVGTIDALLVQLGIRHELTLLSTDRDFEHAARWVWFGRWRSQPSI